MKEKINQGAITMSNADAVKKHHAKLDEFKIRPYKEEGRQIRSAAEKANKSVQLYILDAVREQMKKDEAEAVTNNGEDKEK